MGSPERYDERPNWPLGGAAHSCDQTTSPRAWPHCQCFGWGTAALLCAPSVHPWVAGKGSCQASGVQLKLSRVVQAGEKNHTFAAGLSMGSGGHSSPPSPNRPSDSTSNHQWLSWEYKGPPGPTSCGWSRQSHSGIYNGQHYVRSITFWFLLLAQASS